VRDWFAVNNLHNSSNSANSFKVMANQRGSTAYEKTIQGLCLLLLCVILIAGLWPFHAPRNDVSWLQKGNGLHFGQHGTVLSSGKFRAARAQDDNSCTLEIWLEPGLLSGESTILAFDSSADPRLPFSLRQLGTSLALQRYMVDPQGIVRRPWLKVDRVFRTGEPVLVAITSGTQGTAVYVDGVLTETSSTLGLVSKDLSGQLVLATSTVDDSWTGRIMGLAVYERQLNPAQVRKHFDSVRLSQAPMLPGEEGQVASYRFNEHGGNLIYNRLGPGPDLIIPTRYSVLHPAFFRAEWGPRYYGRSIWARWSFWQDVLVNIAGFIPVGFMLLTYFTSVRAMARPVLVAILLGFCLSFSIEGLQVFLPTRDSDATDLITNTTGTCLGVLLCRFSWAQALWAKTLAYVGFPQEHHPESNSVEALSREEDEVPFPA
jgi:hypothetical protein